MYNYNIKAYYNKEELQQVRKEVLMLVDMMFTLDDAVFSFRENQIISAQGLRNALIEYFKKNNEGLDIAPALDNPEYLNTLYNQMTGLES